MYNLQDHPLIRFNSVQTPDLREQVFGNLPLGVVSLYCHIESSLNPLETKDKISRTNGFVTVINTCWMEIQIAHTSNDNLLDITEMGLSVVLALLSLTPHPRMG
jgi:hypothetical protein